MNLEQLVSTFRNHRTVAYIIPFDTVTDKYQCSDERAEQIILNAMNKVDVDEAILDECIDEGLTEHRIVSKLELIKILSMAGKSAVIRANDEMDKYQAILLIAKEDVGYYFIQETEKYFLIYDYDNREI